MSNLNELIKNAQQNDPQCLETLVVKYKSLVCSIARSYYLLAGGDSDDLIQEGTVGLLKAINKFEPDRNKSFVSFASFCIKNNIKDAIRKSLNEKNVQLSKAVFTDDERESEVAATLDPFAIYIDKEETERLTVLLKSLLSKKQEHILMLYLKGFSYREIAEKLGKTEKYVDNSLSAIKKKIKKNTNKPIED